MNTIPTDALKMPQLSHTSKDEVYLKEKNEDFITLLSGSHWTEERYSHSCGGDVLERQIQNK